MIHAIFAAVLLLGDAQSRAVAQSPAVAEARATLDERRALLDAARSGAAPHAFANYTQAPQLGPDNVASVQQRTTTVGALFNVTDILSADPLARQAAAELRSAIAAEAAAERQERIRTIGLYADAVRTLEIARLRGALVAYARADASAASKRFSAGDVPRLDVVRASVALGKAEADAASADADARSARFALATETGLDAAALEIPTFAALAPSTSLAVPVRDALERSLAHRAEVVAAREDLGSEQAAIRAAERAALPGITAQVGYATGTDTLVPIHGASANVTIDLPLSNAGHDKIDAERARLRAAQARYEAAQRTVRVELDAALNTLDAQRIAVAATARALAEAQAEVRATTTGYRNGVSSSLDVTDARRTYAQAAIDDIAARAALYEAAATLATDMGEQP